jgi:hypothetical protein
VSEDAFAEYRLLDFMESRIPVLDGLTAFVPEGSTIPPELAPELARHSQSRWYPEPGGGHKVMVPREWESYDTEHFAIEPGAWDHDHCDRCRTRIPAMTLCWVTRTGAYVTFCVECKNEMDARCGPTKS